MKKSLFVLLFCVSIGANATMISAGAGVDDYAFTFDVYNDGSQTVNAVLTNTSTSNVPIIELLAFNLFGDVPVEFSNISPEWTLDPDPHRGLFMYIARRVDPDNRLNQGESLTFDMTFDDIFTMDSFLLSEESLGRGIGGGQDFGQVAVHFQRTGLDGEGSDLVAANWQTHQVPEPGTLVLFCFGTFLLVGAGYKRSNINE